ncbi:MAG TPA: YciI family protein [Candidatus Tectomicrobia bacterium]|nr:YciI family protein [Candidatus Tectomicrobia bacterium]
MRYMLLIYLDEHALSEDERQRCYEESTRLAWDLAASGHYLGASPLQPTATATSVRVRDGKALVTDGPFAETREQLGGFFLVEARDRGEAIALASRIPIARMGTVEVRPVVDFPGLPSGAARHERETRQ